MYFCQVFEPLMSTSAMRMCRSAAAPTWSKLELMVRKSCPFAATFSSMLSSMLREAIVMRIGFVLQICQAYHQAWGCLPPCRFLENLGFTIQTPHLLHSSQPPFTLNMQWWTKLPGICYLAGRFMNVPGSKHCRCMANGTERYMLYHFKAPTEARCKSSWERCFLGHQSSTSFNSAHCSLRADLICVHYFVKNIMSPVRYYSRQLLAQDQCGR